MPPLPRALVLIIDNDPNFAREIELALLHHGVPAEIASDGIAGITKVRELQPAVTLIDILMPGVSGIDVARQAREISPKSKVILISGDLGAMRDARKQVRGAHAIIDKPLPLSAVVRYLREALP